MAVVVHICLHCILTVCLSAGRERRRGARGFQQCQTGLDQDQVKLFISCDNTSSTHLNTNATTVIL